VVNYRSILDSGDLELGPITVLTGRNNSGKSALLRAIYGLQTGGAFDQSDTRLRAASGIQVSVRPDPESLPPGIRGIFEGGDLPDDLRLVAQLGDNVQVVFNAGQGARHVGPLTNLRPDHLLVPVLSRRKASGYEPQVGSTSAAVVSDSDRNLTSQIAALTSGDHEEGRRYRDLVSQVLGIPISVFLTGSGQQPGRALSPTEGISLERMGEGVSGALTTVVELATSLGKTFLVEEPENDLHPEALRALLGAIVDGAAAGNQFLVSTHSDLVLRHLGSTDGAIVYHVSLDDAQIPATHFERVTSREERLRLLAELGYEPELPAGWLLFEESTAERVCKQVLIPMFAPGLAGVSTVSSQGASKITRLFEDLHRFVLFGHLSDRYRNRVWVLVDGDSAGREVVSRLSSAYRDWSDDHFQTFDADNFESYYPERFLEETADALREGDWKLRQELKGALAESVCDWAMADPPAARAELAVSAAHVIERLRRIEAQVSG
jgi:predicted ATPase